jgi:hypothetical protein
MEPTKLLPRVITREPAVKFAERNFRKIEGDEDRAAAQCDQFYFYRDIAQTQPPQIYAFAKEGLRTPIRFSRLLHLDGNVFQYSEFSSAHTSTGHVPQSSPMSIAPR